MRQHWLASIAFGGLFMAPTLAQEPTAKPTVAPLATKTDRPEIYDAKADARQLVRTAVFQANRDRSRVLVMFGGNWCGWCHKLHGLFRSDREIAGLIRAEFVLAMVDTAAPGAEELMDEWKVERSKGLPYLVVLDGSGKVVARQETGVLEEGDHHDPALVKKFLAANQAEPVQASAVLEKALASAGDQDKRVLLHFGAPWCGWCHKLDDFLARPEIAELMARDFLEVKLDTERMPGGQTILDQYCKKPEGIPWTVILDKDGKPLIDSQGPKGNIGYPGEPHEIAHFVTMLRQTARSLTQADLDRIETELKKASEAMRQSASNSARPDPAAATTQIIPAAPATLRIAPDNAKP